jgi:hypothetical protein
MTLGRAPARRPARGTLALVVALSAVSGGCSFRWVVPPPSPSTWPETVQPDTSEERCTATSGPAILDTVAVGILAPLAYVERNAYTTKGVTNADSTGAPLREFNTGPNHFSLPRSVGVPTPSYLARGIAVGFGIGALVAAVSAVYGYVESSRCRRYKALFHPE